ncbi:GLEYA domain-containing protein [Microdochium nivale]|nr:GLEYA domain-containing protein [Microdochium nivale]
MRTASSVVSLLLPLAAWAAPAPVPEPQGGILDPLLCLLNNLLVGLRNDPLAIPYCSSVLGIQPRTLTAAIGVTIAPTLTSTVNVGGATVTLTVGRTVTRATVTSTSTATSTVTSTVRSTTSVSTISCLDAAYTAPVRRAVDADNVQLEKRQSVGLSLGLTPTIFPPNAQPSQISSACSCLRLTTNTITITPTVSGGATVTSLVTVNLGAAVSVTLTLDVTTTPTVVSTTTTTTTSTTTQNVVATTIANPQGLQYERFTHDFTAYDNSGFNVQYFKNANPVATGFATSPRLSSPGWPFGGTTISFGGQDFEGGNAAILFHGFYVARATGDHVISSSGDTIDNWGYFWTGNNAYSAYSEVNANFMAVRVDGAPYTGGSATLTMNAGDAVPITWLWANGGGVGQSDFTVTIPGGTGNGGVGNFVPACSANTFP